jgi:hypothetical protein
MLKLTDTNVKKEMYEDYIRYLLEKYFNINTLNIINPNPFLSFSCFYPLPISFDIDNYKDIDKINKNNDEYDLIGICSNNRILFADRLLPNTMTDPIPFTFPIKINENTVELINTNCFYFEVTVCERTRESWLNETISIGYGSITTPFRCNPGWVSDSIGYNLDDGTIQFNQIVNKNGGPFCNIGDTLGAGIKYISSNNYKFFFTFNGSLIDNKIIDTVFIIKTQMIPIIGYDHSCKIKVNFGQDIFKFNFKSYSSTNTTISNSNQFINDHNFINKINTNKIIKKKIQENKNAINKLLSQTFFTPMFTLSENNNEINAILSIISQNNL